MANSIVSILLTMLIVTPQFSFFQCLLFYLFTNKFHLIHGSQNIKFKTSFIVQNIPCCSLLPSKTVIS